MNHTTLNRCSIVAFAFLLPAAVTLAQVRPSGDTMEYDDKQHSAITLDLNIPVDNAKDYFKDFMKERHDVHVNGLGFLQNRTVLSVERADIPAMHAKAMDLFIRFEEAKGDAALVQLIGRDGYDLYFSEAYQPATHARLVDLMRSFKTYALEEHYKALLAEQQDDLKDLTRAREKMTRTVSKNKDEQADNRKRNRQLDDEIKELEKKKKDGDLSMDALREDILRSKAELPAEK